MEIGLAPEFLTAPHLRFVMSGMISHLTGRNHLPSVRPFVFAARLVRNPGNYLFLAGTAACKSFWRDYGKLEIEYAPAFGGEESWKTSEDTNHATRS